MIGVKLSSEEDFVFFGDRNEVYDDVGVDAHRGEHPGCCIGPTDAVDAVFVLIVKLHNPVFILAGGRSLVVHLRDDGN
jgi:hypothetical protein